MISPEPTTATSRSPGAATTPWQTFGNPQASFSGTLLGTFRGGKQTDILEYVHNGNALERFKLWIGLSAYLTWSQQDML